MILLYKTYCIEYEFNFKNKAKTILFLHGWGGNKNSFIKANKFFNNLYNTITLSMPPYNDSCIPLTLNDYKNIVVNILTLLNINKIIIICHSFGMRVALMLASTNIDIEKIIITGGAGIKFKPNILKKLNNQFHSIILKSHNELFETFASQDYKNLSLIDRQTFKNIVNKDLKNYIKLLSCPIFLFWGKKDCATPIKTIKIFKTINPNVHSYIVNNGDHFCYLNYSDLFINCCQNFLEN